MAGGLCCSTPGGGGNGGQYAIFAIGAGYDVEIITQPDEPIAWIVYFVIIASLIILVLGGSYRYRLFLLQKRDKEKYVHDSNTLDTTDKFGRVMQGS